MENIHMFSNSGYNKLESNLQKTKQKILNLEILDMNIQIQHIKLEIDRLRNTQVTAGYQKLMSLSPTKQIN